MTRVPCEACCGTGSRELQVHEADTIEAVGSEWSTTDVIAGRVKFPSTISVQALSNRLGKLETLGLVERRPVNGKIFEWRIVKETKRSAGREVVTTARKAG